MAELRYPYREDWSWAGWFGFSTTGVQYADSGIKGLKRYAPFDQGEWFKQDDSGASLLARSFDAGTSRVTDALTSTIAGTYKLYRRLRLPRNFGSWSTVTLMVSKNASPSHTSLAVTMYQDAAADAGVTAVTLLPSTADTWQQFTLTPTGTPAPGSFVTFVVTYVAAAADATIFLADWVPLYVTDKGTV